jgi:hypothetical protein
MQLLKEEDPSLRLRRALEAATPRMRKPKPWRRCLHGFERAWLVISVFAGVAYAVDELRPMTASEGLVLAGLLQVRAYQAGTPVAAVWGRLAAEHGLTSPQMLTQWQAEKLESELVHCLKAQEY